MPQDLQPRPTAPVRAHVEHEILRPRKHARAAVSGLKHSAAAILARAGAVCSCSLRLQRTSHSIRSNCAVKSMRETVRIERWSRKLGSRVASNGP